MRQACHHNREHQGQDKLLIYACLWVSFVVDSMVTPAVGRVSRPMEDSSQPVTLICRDPGGDKTVGKFLKGNILTGGCGAADAGAYIHYQNNGRGLVPRASRPTMA